VKLAGLLEKTHVVHVQGTLSSGKTMFATLLTDHYCQDKQKAMGIRCWSKTFDLLEYLVKHYNKVRYVVTSSKILYKIIMIIVDKAQTFYINDLPWLGPIKT
jgi:hypothetical protein